VFLRLLPVVFLAALRLQGAQPAVPLEIADDEFVGPFTSWSRLTTGYGAAGDGERDDTPAFQRALDELGRGGRSSVLFVPSGRYRITRTLTLTDALHLAVVGDDPAATTILWDGPPAGTMLLVNGVAYSTFSRLTFDGRGRAATAIEQSWENRGGHFDTGNEYSDLVLTGVDYGIRGGFKGHGFAETTIARSRFVRNLKAGVSLGNFNALDVWIRDSTFDHCGIGVTNEPGAGNFRVYGSLFIESETADLFMQNTGLFSARDNYSFGSPMFFGSGPPFNHPATVVLQRNTIVDSRIAAVRMGNQGPGLLYDNVVRSPAERGGPVVSWRSPIESDLISLGNRFTVPQPLTSNGRFISIDDRTVAAASIAIDRHDPAEPLPNRAREVVSVMKGADARAIQDAITSAAKRGGRTVVHIPFGQYEIAETLTVPASDVQIAGDGYTTALKWTGAGDGPVVRIDGPTHATLRDLQIDGNGRATVMAVRGIDQPGSRLLLDGLQIHAGVTANVVVRGLDHARTELVGGDHADARGGTSLRLEKGKTTIFSGSSSNNLLSYDISEGADVVVRDIWYEGTVSSTFARIHGRANVTFENVRVALPAGRSEPAFAIEDLQGQVALLGVHLDDRIIVSGDVRDSEVLGLGLLREYLPGRVLTAPPGARVRLLASRQRARTQGLFSPGSEQVPDDGVVDRAFVTRLLSAARSTTPPLRTKQPADISDLRLFRVWLQNGTTNLIVSP
jgi:hypothetical protein